jgi:hypothetical protein
MAQKPKAHRVTSEDRGNSETKTQSERFIEAARELGVDETGKEFERALSKIVPKRQTKRRS